MYRFGPTRRKMKIGGQFGLEGKIMLGPGESSPMSPRASLPSRISRATPRTPSPRLRPADARTAAASQTLQRWLTHFARPWRHASAARSNSSSLAPALLSLLRLSLRRRSLRPGLAQVPLHRRVQELAVRVVAEDGLAYQAASSRLWRDHRVFVPLATVQNSVEAAGGKKGGQHLDHLPRRGAGSFLRLSGHRRDVRRAILHPSAWWTIAATTAWPSASWGTTRAKRTSADS